MPAPIKRDRVARYAVDDEPFLKGTLFESKAIAAKEREIARLWRAFHAAGLTGDSVRCPNPASLFARLLVEKDMLRKGAIDRLLEEQIRALKENEEAITKAIDEILP